MKKTTQLIVYVLLFQVIALPQVLRPIDKAQLIFYPKIVRDSSSGFIYSYNITNNANSEKAADSFDLTVVDSLLTDNVTIITGPVNKKWYIDGTSKGYIGGSAANRFVDLPIPPADALFPGETMSISFKSSGLPAIMPYYAQSFSVPFNMREEDSLFALGYTGNQINANWKTDSYKNLTVAPNTNLLNLSPINFLDTLSSYTTQSRTLGWITTQPTTDKYLGYFATAKTQLQGGNTNGAKTTLQQVLTDVNVDSSSALTSEGYALLRFNTEYLLSTSPQNVGAVFTTPQTVKISWSPGSMSVGYNVYRAVMYEGAVLSYIKANTSLLLDTAFIDSPNISSAIAPDKNVYLRYYVEAVNSSGGVSLPSAESSLFVGRTMSGAISSAASWNENKIVVGDVTVNNGASLSISPGVTVRFAGGKNLVSYGVLTAIGTPSQKITFTPLTTKTPGSWGSILMREAGAAGSAIEYAVVQYGNVLQVLNVQGTGVNVSHSTFDYAINAVRYTNSRGLISECFINTPRDHGIQIESSSFASAYQNTITKTNKSGGGILFAGGGVGNAWKNSINGFNWGIGMYWGAAPMLGDTLNQGINNRITNCLRGLNIYNWAYPVVGYPSDIDDGMTYGNNIFGNTKNVYIYTTPDDTIFAQNVYWNSSNPVSTMYIGGSVLKFDYSNFLTDSTWQSAQPQAPFINRAKPSAAIQQSEVLLSGDERNLREGIKLRLKGKFTEAKNYFRLLVKNNPNNVQAFVELYKMLNTGEADEIEQTFVAYAKNSPAIVKMLQSFLFVKRGKISAAKLINSALMQEHPNSAISARAAMNNFYIALYNENNLQQATKILKEISSKPELTTDVELSLAQHALDTYIAPRSTNRRSEQ